jgi:hypothetical protein
MIRHLYRPTPTAAEQATLLLTLTRALPGVSVAVTLESDRYVIRFAERWFFGDAWDQETWDACDEVLHEVSRTFRLPTQEPAASRVRSVTRATRGDAFDGCHNREPHVRLLLDAIHAGQHALLYGPPAAGKTRVLLGFQKLAPVLLCGDELRYRSGVYEARARSCGGRGESLLA